MTKKIVIAGIDCQNDFIDLPDAYCPINPVTGLRMKPALAVAGGHRDMQRFAAFIERHLDLIEGITMTFDAHPWLHIGNLTFYKLPNGQYVPKFMEITAGMMESGEVTTAVPEYRERTIGYMKALEAGGKHKVRAWPVHCLEGTWGQNLHADVQAAVDKWQARRNRNVSNVFKGRNMFAEHYSPVRAEVVDPSDPSTSTNYEFINSCNAGDLVVMGGEAASHCARGAGLDLLEYIDPNKIVVLSDCMSAVYGCDSLANDFYDQMRRRGARVMTSAELSAQLAQA